MNLEELQDKEIGSAQRDRSKDENEMMKLKILCIIQSYHCRSMMDGITIWKTEFSFEKRAWNYVGFITLFKWCSLSFPFLTFTPVSYLSWVYMGLELWGREHKEGKRLAAFWVKCTYRSWNLASALETEQHNPYSSS